MKLILPSKIGMMDSGIGGFSVLNELLPVLPPEVLYVADAAHLPYGEKSVEFLFKRATAITHFFEEHGITTIFVACHTLSATVISTLQKEFPHIRYIDLLPLTVRHALMSTKNNRIGVMATPATITSHVHQRLLITNNTLSSSSTITVVEQACPDFVHLIERKASTAECMPAVTAYLSPLLVASVDTIILGCTHYPFLQNLLKKEAPQITFISAANALPKFEKSKNTPSLHFVTTASVTYLEKAVDHFLRKDHNYILTLTSKQSL